MSNQVKCRLCGKLVDREIAYRDNARNGWYYCNMEHFIENQEKVAKKSHKSTLTPKQAPNEQARKDLVSYIYQLYNKQIPQFVFKQIKDMTERKQKPLTYKGIELSLRYWVETLGKPFDSDTGIGIVEYIYDQAEQFWKDKQRVRIACQDMQIDKILTKSGCQNRIDVIKYNLRRKASNDIQSNSEPNGSRNDYE